MKQVVTPLLIVWCVVMLAGCSGSGSTAQGPVDVSTDQTPVDLRGTETFDSESYTIEPPSIIGEVDHDVPDELMLGDTGDNRMLRTVSGFRIQILSTLVKDEAVAKESQANRWYESLSPSARSEGLGSSRLAVYLHFQSPYYRVRVGNFGRRSEAETALDMVQDVFPNAFIAVDTVSIYR